MTLEIGLVMAIAIGAMVLFISEALRADAVALLVLVSLAALGLVTPTEALSGFSNQATITVASMFILAAGLQSSGALSGVNKLLSKAKSGLMLQLMLFALLIVIAPFVNNTAVVAVFIPIVISACLNIGVAPSKTLIPLSYVSQMTGVCTLIGTSTNLIVNSVAQDLGHPGFSMFEFVPLGAICLFAGMAYLLTVGRWLLPEVNSADVENLYEFGHYITELSINDKSKLIGETISDAKLGEEYKIYVLDLLRDGEKLAQPRSTELQEGDVLLARGKWPDIEKLADELKVDTNHDIALKQDSEKSGTWMMVELMIAPNSLSSGRKLSMLKRHWRYRSTLMGIQRKGQIVRNKVEETRLRVGDIILLAILEEDMNSLRRDKSVIILSERESIAGKGWRAPFALATMAAVVAVAAVGWLPIAVSSLMGAVAVTLAGCLRADEVYESTDWTVVVLMAGLLPLGVAMSSTGAAEFIVQNTIGFVQGLGPQVVLAVLYLMALFFGELMSNSAAAVLLTPIGMSTATMMDTNATPYLIAITFSASTSFLTPVGYQTNMMVYNAGGYQFSDFIKIGLPLNLIFWGLGVIFIPIFWPF